MFVVISNKEKYFSEEIIQTEQGVTLSKAFQMKEISVNILNQLLTSSYKIDNEESEITFITKDGYFIKEMSEEEINSENFSFIKRNENDAKLILKDKELELYRNLIPDLIKKVEVGFNNSQVNNFEETNIEESEFRNQLISRNKKLLL